MTADELVAFAEDLARIAAGGGGPQALAEHLAVRTGTGVFVEGLPSGTGCGIVIVRVPLVGSLSTR